MRLMFALLIALTFAACGPAPEPVPVQEETASEATPRPQTPAVLPMGRIWWAGASAS